MPLTPEEVANFPLPPPESLNGGRADGASVGRTLAVSSYDTIRAERTRWLWDQRIPLGTVTLLVGREKLGKSTLCCELAAQLSRGELAGDVTGQPSATLIVSYEDSAARTIKPRLMAAGANLTHIHQVTADSEHGPDLVSLPTDVDQLGAAALNTGARLVIVDPLSASLGSDVDGHRDQDIRRAIAPLVALAERLDLAVLCLAHLNKSQAGDALTRVLGSRGLTAAARSVLTFGRPPDVAEDSPDRVLAHPASNLAPEAASLAWRHEGREVQGDDDEVIPTNRLVLIGECDTKADELIVTRSNDERTDTESAAEWLSDELAEGSWRPSREIKATAKQAGYSDKVLRRARDQLHVETRRDGFATAGGGQSEWRIPLVPSTTDAEGTSAEGTSNQSSTSSGINPNPDAARAPTPTQGTSAGGDQP